MSSNQAAPLDCGSLLPLSCRQPAAKPRDLKASWTSERLSTAGYGRESCSGLQQSKAVAEKVTAPFKDDMLFCARRFRNPSAVDEEAESALMGWFCTLWQSTMGPRCSYAL
jgi:hypothetical protein